MDSLAASLPLYPFRLHFSDLARKGIDTWFQIEKKAIKTCNMTSSHLFSIFSQQDSSAHRRHQEESRWNCVSRSCYGLIRPLGQSSPNHRTPPPFARLNISDSAGSPASCAISQSPLILSPPDPMRQRAQCTSIFHLKKLTSAIPKLSSTHDSHTKFLKIACLRKLEEKKKDIVSRAKRGVKKKKYFLLVFEEKGLRTQYHKGNLTRSLGKMLPFTG